MKPEPKWLARIKKLVSVFVINDKPADQVMSLGQLTIVAAIVLRVRPRVACVAPTGYGKSEAISIGAILRVMLKREPFVIASVKYGTSDIIMKKVIDHLFDVPDFIAELQYDGTEALDRLQRERRKTSLNFKNGGGIKIVSLFGPDNDVSKTIGEHSPNVILDESPLLSPAKYLQVLKILEGTGDYNTTFLFELGNAINRNHFMQNVLYNTDYYRINISLDQAISEKRLDPKSVDEKRGMPFFEQFYLNQFPAEDEIDHEGYRQLVTDAMIQSATLNRLDLTDEPMRMGVDIGGGGDSNVYAIRQGDHAWIEAENRSNDTMTNVTQVIELIDKYTIYLDRDGHHVDQATYATQPTVYRKVRLLEPEAIAIDDIGIGRGVTDRLYELDYYVKGEAVGGEPVDKSKYKNIKAENFWLLREWLQSGGKLEPHAKWSQLTWIKYKISSDKVLQIEPKDKLKERTGKSPDHAEALMLSFSEGRIVPGVR
jgi:hypothetical protein